MKPTEVKAPEGYRLLRDGEVIRAGDVFLPNDTSLGWLPVYMGGYEDRVPVFNHTRCKPHARKVQ